MEEMEIDKEFQRPSPNPMEVEEKEGRYLLGSPTFVELGDGRFKCSETGHELPAGEMKSYSNSKSCRLALIDSALLHKKVPLNFFKRDPNSKSKLICRLTGDMVNKSEEHIWKHIIGRRFQKRLERKEAEMETSDVMVEKEGKPSDNSPKSK